MRSTDHGAGYVMDGTTPFRVIFRAFPKPYRPGDVLVEKIYIGLPYTGPRTGKFEHVGFALEQHVQQAVDHHSFHHARLNARLNALRACLDERRAHLNERHA